jgi:hypothetical protein
VLDLLPAEASIVAQAQVTRLRQTRLFEKALKAHGDGRGDDGVASDSIKAYNEFRTETGFDLSRDLDSVTTAVPDHVDTSRTFLVVARGRFDETRLVAFMAKRAAGRGQALTAEPYKGVTLRGQAQEPRVRLAFLRPTTVLFGSVDWVKRAIDQSRGEATGPALQKNDTLMALIRRTRVDRGLWAVAVVPEKLRDRLPVPGKKVTVRTGSVSLDFVSGLQLDVIAETASPGDAQSVVQAATGALDLMRGFGPVVLGGYGPYLEALKLTARSSAAELSVNLTRTQLDELIDRLERFLAALKSSEGQPRNGASQTP